ncbi:hypothetical protein [Pseudomonas phage Misse]|uniref:RNA polymerase n=1 Tax=Pseudomonas phage Bertil TaxID=2801385 RepID=A0A7T8IW68_9CAUD|nr:RNA polymerase [Pseudomonas phage Bertil]QQO90847.1 hypothetical protein [Pseudomonas phage Misse]QQO90899.1 hypothetical protein [Pseudomonas phage Strit]
MSQVSWGALNGDDEHQALRRKVYAAMESGHNDEARKLLDEYAKQNKSYAESLRLSLIRDFGTGL